MERLKEMGILMMSGIEYEFVLYQKGTKQPVHSGFDFGITNISAKYVSSVYNGFLFGSFCKSKFDTNATPNGNDHTQTKYRELAFACNNCRFSHPLRTMHDGP